jgi:hypothetical protein
LHGDCSSFCPAILQGYQHQQLSVQRASLCQSEYTSEGNAQNAAIAGAYGVISGPASNSDSDIKTAQKNYCEGHFGTYWRDQLRSEEYNSVSAEGAEVVKECFRANSTAFRVSKIKFVGNALSIHIAWNGGGPMTIDGAVIMPTGIAACDFLMNGKRQSDLSKLQGMQLQSGDGITLACERNGNELAGQNGRLKFTGGLITVTPKSGDAVQVPLIEYTVPAVDETTAENLSRRLSIAESQIGILSEQVDSLSKGMTNLTQSLTGVVMLTHEGSECPSGYHLYATSLLPIWRDHFANFSFITPKDKEGSGCFPSHPGGLPLRLLCHV